MSALDRVTFQEALDMAVTAWIAGNFRDATAWMRVADLRHRQEGSVR